LKTIPGFGRRKRRPGYEFALYISNLLSGYGC
jgi:hypothetical protein